MAVNYAERNYAWANMVLLGCDDPDCFKCWIANTICDDEFHNFYIERDILKIIADWETMRGTNPMEQDVC